MNNKILDLFGKAIANGESSLDFAKVNEYAVKLGYLVHPSLCNSEVFAWLKSNDRNYNSTFYKKWTDVISKNRFELYVDQLKHYASTYGTDFKGEPYLPSGVLEVPEFTKFKVIMPIKAQEVIDRCKNMLFSGIALKQTTLADVLAILDGFYYSYEMEKIKNKEAKMFIYKNKNLVPSEPVEMVRFLVYLATDKTLLIKDRDTIAKIKSVVFPVTDLITKFGIEKLSSVFYRFKPLFLAMKKGPDAKVINKLRRAAKKNHVANEPGYFERILRNKADVWKIDFELSALNNFRKIRLLQAISVRMKNLNIRAFGIRNQKLYIKTGHAQYDPSYLRMVYDIIYKSLIYSLKSKACTIKIPEGVNITLPASEKSFIGNYPLGSSFDFSNTDNIVGINWRGEDGASDLDLKLIDIDGRQYGWNAAYKNHANSIVYSGDMTSATPEATELFYTKKDFKPAIVKVNLYSGSDKSKFKFFIAREKISKIDRNYMVNPDNIVVNVDCEMDSKEMQLGVITGEKFILAQFRTGKGRVAGDSITNKYTEYALSTLDCYLDLRRVLNDAGFTITDNNPAIDLSELSKDTLISLLS